MLQSGRLGDCGGGGVDGEDSSLWFAASWRIDWRRISVATSLRLNWLDGAHGWSYFIEMDLQSRVLVGRRNLHAVMNLGDV